MAKKFIINNGRILLGDVPFHEMLAKDHSGTVGGGSWFYDHLTDTMYLYGFSTEFGPVTREQIQNAWSWTLEGRKVIYSPSRELGEALKSTDLITQSHTISG